MTRFDFRTDSSVELDFRTDQVLGVTSYLRCDDRVTSPGGDGHLVEPFVSGVLMPRGGRLGTCGCVCGIIAAHM